MSFLGLVGAGLWNVAITAGHPQPVVPPLAMVGATGAMSVWLFMRAFASGCTAMTGVEAVSNGVSAFKEPVVDQAHKTLTVICLVLGILLAGIATIAHFYETRRHGPNQGGLSKRAVPTRRRDRRASGIIYYIAMTSLSGGNVPLGQYGYCRLSPPMPENRHPDGSCPRFLQRSPIAGLRLSVGILVLSLHGRAGCLSCSGALRTGSSRSSPSALS